ncbi:hypothetical protein LOD99_10691 [Oopsacas minuta]|uniref:DNA 3'-5' helicase n=1 Tax=Oopsacas minuta TaxID=111878 RepID=A0AAV7KF92_9METZ|nr:hypothetical protein LOD99_10691 [Oopsacas minuta]
MMVAFCENLTDCRRVLILNYLGEEFSAEECGKTCDNCREKSAGDIMEKDMTAETQNIILSVRLLPHSNLTLIQMADIFRGCQGQKMYQSNYNTLPMYGRSGGLSRTDIDRFLHLLIISEVLVEQVNIGLHDRVFNYVKIGPEAEKVLKETKKILFRCSPIIATKSKQKNATNDEIANGQTAGYPNFAECLDQLRTLRHQVAEDCDLSPENIFNMATLREMSYNTPETRATFLAVTGVTESKWNKFKGEAFLEVTAKFCELKRQFLAAQADTLVTHTTQSHSIRNSVEYSRKAKSKYFKNGKNSKQKFVKNWRGKSTKNVSSDLTRSGVKTVSYTRAGSSTTGFLAPPLPRGRRTT